MPAILENRQTRSIANSKVQTVPQTHISLHDVEEVILKIKQSLVSSDDRELAFCYSSLFRFDVRLDEKLQHSNCDCQR